MKLKVLFLMLIVAGLSSCSTQKSTLRYLKNHPSMLDSMTKEVVVEVTRESTDTMFVASLDTISLVDTFYHENIRIILKQDASGNYRDTIEVLVPADTISIKVPVTEYIIKNVVKDKSSIELVFMYLGIIFAIALVVGIVMFIKNMGK